MIAFSSDGRLLAGHENVSYYENVQVKKRDYAIKVWDTVTGRIKREIPVAHAAINSLAVSGDGEHIAVGNENGSIEIWSLRTGKISRVLRGHKDQVDALLFGPGGNTLISGSFRSARVWDVQRGKTTHLLTGLTDDVRVLSLDAYAHDVVVVCQDSTIRRWDYRTWKLKKAITQRVSPFTFASLSADGRFLATAVTYEGLEHQARSAIWVRDTRSGRTVWKIVSMGGVGPFAIAPDGSRVAVGVEVENGRGLLQIFQTNPSATKGQSLLRKLGR
jgi:WD40 repeat protein